MALLNTKAIVFSAIKYGDTNLIVKCFTKAEGLKSYMVRGVLKSRKGKLKAAYFQPLTQLELTASHNTKGTLHTIREAHVINPYETIHTSIVKQTILLFLSEVLSTSIQEEEENSQLYGYLESSLLWLDTHTNVSNFHLLFLLNLSRFLGFYPDVFEQDKTGFNLLEGSFTNATYEATVVSGGALVSFKKLLGIHFDAIENVSFSKKERQIILQLIIRYFELHLDGFKKPKSLAILETVFS